MIPANHSNML